MAVLPPTGLKAIPGNVQVKLTWNPVLDVISYNVYRGFPVSVLIATVGEETYLDIDVALVNGQEESYAVDVTTSAGTSVKSAVVTSTPNSILVVEDGTGVVLANVYEGLDATLSRLSNLGYHGLESINVLREPVLILGTKSVNASLAVGDITCPVSDDQGLHYPRVFEGRRRTLTISSDVIPDDVLLVSALKAEFLAQDQHDDSNVYSNVPSNIKRVEMAKGVQVEKFQGKLQSNDLEFLSKLIASTILGLTAEIPIFAGVV